MAAELFIPPSKALDANANPYAGAKWFFYATGTTTPQSVYTTAALSTAHANPVVADSSGKFANIFFDETLIYRAVLKNSDESVTLHDIDPVTRNFGRFLQAGTGAVARTTQAKLRDIVSVKDFGAVGNGVANDRLAIINTIAAVKANGGGTVLFPKGQYLVSGVQQVVSIPEISGTFAYVATSNDVQIYVTDLNNVNFVFDGAKLVSNKTNGGYTLLFDGCSNLTFNNLQMTGATVMTGSTVSTTGTNGIGFVSFTQNSENITLNNTRINDHYTSFDVAGDPASAFRVTNLTLTGSTYFYKGDYGLACRGNGVNVLVENIYTYGKNRGFFIYDTVQVSVTGTIDFASNANTGLGCLVKAYTTNTRNIKIDCVFKNKANLATSRLAFQSQHNPATQPTPAYVVDVFVKYTEENCGAFGLGIEYNYFQNTTSQASSTGTLFNNFTFVGNSNNRIITTVTLGAANVCNVNLDNFYDDKNDTALRKKELLNNTGFVGAKRFTYTPGLQFGGGSTGMTFTDQSADYYIQGGLCTVIGKLTLSAKGSSTGAAQLIMPVYSREDTPQLPVFSVLGVSGMSGLTSPILGYVEASASINAPLFMQGAASLTNLADTNFTNTSQISFQVSYPV
jgi:hypothetical protein